MGILKIRNAWMLRGQKLRGRDIPARGGQGHGRKSYELLEIGRESIDDNSFAEFWTSD